ncbi:glutathione S-transferase family protein [Aquincola sp. S2]|uniref:Glutathione S-transferase family protein n=1 Tax=Pseudaquabacterium terrae TaxID=2732868 RepID=A0ABX2ETR5_9BURK|nr:glutathione S-transferase family protein [Aquabacterium terrae]NRF71861.1 glutathione S-transferase family protein [Aquabacterium terrae]
MPRPFVDHAAQLFGLERSVYTRIARLALEEKGVPYTLHETEIFGPGGVPAEHLARHPFGRIPVLQHGDFSLYETAAITRYVDEAFTGPPLQPSPPAERARMSQVIGLLDAYAYRPMVWGVFVERFSAPRAGRAPDEARIRAALPQVEQALRALQALAAGEAFLLRGGLSLADLHLFPMLCYFALTPDGDESLRSFPRLHDWLAMMSARPSVERTRSTYERS